MDPRTPIEPWEQAQWRFEDVMIRYRHARDAGNLRAMKAAMTLARIAYEALGDEMDRLADEVEGRAVA
jgi:hypothetical protein